MENNDYRIMYNEVKEIQKFKAILLCVSLCLLRVLCVKMRKNLKTHSACEAGIISIK